MAEANYKGWRNYETWLVYNAMDREELEAYDDEILSEIERGIDDEIIAASVAAELEEAARDAVAAANGGTEMFGGLPVESLEMVDWLEIAEYLVEDAFLA